MIKKCGDSICAGSETPEELQPFTVTLQREDQKYGRGPRTYQQKFNAIEDSVWDKDFAGPFNEDRFGPHASPNTWESEGGYALERLRWVPLTTRGDGTIDLTDDRPPTDSGSRFQAYWHHPYDWWLDSNDEQEGSAYYYKRTNNGNKPGADKCGQCFILRDSWPVRLAGEACGTPQTYDCRRPPSERPPGLDCGGTTTEGDGQI